MAEMVTGSCHCGRVRFAVSRLPAEVTKCNCSICSKLGSLCVYYPPEDFEILEGEAALRAYSWGDQMLDFRFCRSCGCHVHWQARAGREADCFPEGTPPKLGVNARLIDGLDVEALPMRLVDGRSF